MGPIAPHCTIVSVPSYPKNKFVSSLAMLALHDTKLVSVTSRHVTPRHATPRHATPRHATSRHATPRHVTSRHAMSRHSQLSSTPLQSTPVHATSLNSPPLPSTPRWHGVEFAPLHFTSYQSTPIYFENLPFHSQEWSISDFPCGLTRNIPSHSTKNFTFHRLLRWKMIILQTLTTALIHFSLKGWENVLFELASERVNPVLICWRQLPSGSERTVSFFLFFVFCWIVKNSFSYAKHKSCSRCFLIIFYLVTGAGFVEAKGTGWKGQKFAEENRDMFSLHWLIRSMAHWIML